MEVLARVGGSAYALVALVIGLRLVLLWKRTRGLPELLIGTSMLLLAGFGYPLSAAAREATDLAMSTRNAMGAAAALLAAIGVVCNTGFSWVLFRRGESWATALFVLVGVAAAGLFLGQSAAGDWWRGEYFWGCLPVAIAVSYGWAAFECARYHLLLRRRQKIGLADPVVTDRFGLYAAATAMALVINLAGMVFWWSGIEMLTHPFGGSLLFVTGTISSALMMLAFLPPRAYVARVRARAAEVA